MTIAGACRPPTRDYADGWHAAGGLLSTLLDSGSGASVGVWVIPRGCSLSGLHPVPLRWSHPSWIRDPMRAGRDGETRRAGPKTHHTMCLHAALCERRPANWLFDVAVTPPSLGGRLRT